MLNFNKITEQNERRRKKEEEEEEEEAHAAKRAEGSRGQSGGPFDWPSIDGTGSELAFDTRY